MRFAWLLIFLLLSTSVIADEFLEAKCAFGPPFSCVEYKVNTTIFRVVVQNNGEENITISNLHVSQVCQIEPDKTFLMQGERVLFESNQCILTNLDTDSYARSQRAEFYMSLNSSVGMVRGGIYTRISELKTPTRIVVINRILYSLLALILLMPLWLHLLKVDNSLKIIILSIVPFFLWFSTYFISWSNNFELFTMLSLFISLPIYSAITLYYGFDAFKKKRWVMGLISLIPPLFFFYIGLYFSSI
ncbi:hypothetical protein GOV11_02660 [Candidatus Woesearchaeota archaeon]|nr:hypothetical protein [Candidatus Woesearchaeota archaeon]